MANGIKATEIYEKIRKKIKSDQAFLSSALNITRDTPEDVADASCTAVAIDARGVEMARFPFGVFHKSGVTNHTALYVIEEGEAAYNEALRSARAADRARAAPRDAETAHLPQILRRPRQEVVLWMPRASIFRFATEVKEKLSESRDLEALLLPPAVSDFAFKAVFLHRSWTVRGAQVYTLDALTWRDWGVAWTSHNKALFVAPVSKREELIALATLFESSPASAVEKMKALDEIAERARAAEGYLPAKIMQWLTETCP